MKRCGNCGKDLVYKGRGRPRKYCDDCGHPARAERPSNCAYCGEPLPRNGSMSKYCDSTCRQRNSAGFVVKVCARCGGELPNQHYTYCSSECKNAFKNLSKPPRTPRECAYCGDRFVPKHKNHKFCSDEHARAYDNEVHRLKRARGNSVAGGKYCYVCEYCGKEYRTDYEERNRFCSRDHYFEWLKENASTTYCVICGAETDGTKYCSEKCMNGYEHTCPVCRVGFLGSVRQVYCSDDCINEKERQRAYEAAKAEHERTTEPRPCKNCAKVFTPKYGDKRRDFCSKKCCASYYKTGRNNFQRAEYYGVRRKWFSEKKILRRDGWRCYICGERTPPKLRGTRKPNAPEIDHVIPLSRGGAHVPGNVHCCCRRCNLRKGDQTLDEFLGKSEKSDGLQLPLIYEVVT